MKIHRFIGNFDLSKNEVEITNPENIKQIKDVLRMKKGGVIILSNGKGNSAEVTLVEISANKITGIVNEKISARTTLAETRIVNLYLAILKKENFELAAQKAVECGVSTITPIITERTIKTGLNIPRLEKIIREASEQSGRDIVPTLSSVLKLEDALSDGNKSDEKIIFHLGGANLHKGGGNASALVSIFIGPEGGWTEKEIALAKNSGYTIASLGPLTLRGETAAIVATYLAVYGK
jgi:16S rRNA (uracil1498-N3)-methyltransferase